VLHSLCGRAVERLTRSKFVVMDLILRPIVFSPVKMLLNGMTSDRLSGCAKQTFAKARARAELGHERNWGLSRERLGCQKVWIRHGGHLTGR